uniref:Tetratricopeptide repeat protein 21B n=1 Tax=Glossina pallidipes TaxID=7398 RepID=A0A1A9ZZ57_GLOPL
MDIQDIESVILYYGRSEFFYTMQKAALDGLSKFPHHSAFRLFNGIALVLSNHLQEGIRELNPLKNDPELGICSIIALLYAHKRCHVIDRESVTSFEQRLKEDIFESANASYNAAVFLFFIKKFEKSREYVEKSLKLDAHHISSLILKVWIDLSKSPKVLNGNVGNMLEGVLGENKNIDAALALARHYQLCGQFDNAINSLNKLSVWYPDINIPLVVKTEIQLSASYWDQTYETSLRVINLEPTNISALRVTAILLVVREGNIKGGISTLQQLLVATERIEQGNWPLLLRICQLFARICSRNVDLLTLTARFIEKQTQLNTSSVELVTELGYQQILLGNIKMAVGYFRTATAIDNTSFHALCGLTLCQLFEQGVTEQTRQQVEFLTDLRPSKDKPLLLLLQAKLAPNNDTAVSLLAEATKLKLVGLEGLLFGPEYLHKLDPEFLLQIVTEFLRYSPVQVRVKQGVHLVQESSHVSLKHCIAILDKILDWCPSHVQALFKRSKVHFLCGELQMASSRLQHILNNIDTTYTSAYLLLAQVQMQQQQYSKAMQSLELSLSYNFLMRENPLYNLLLGIAYRQQQQYKDAQKSFNAALHLLHEDPVQDSKNSSIKRAEVLNGFSTSDEVTLYLELIGTLRDMGGIQEMLESERLLECALEKFKDTSEEGRLKIAQAELMLQNSNVNKAIELLAAIKPGESYYVQAKTHLASIHLLHRKDRVAFATCFTEIVETSPESESYVMLGEAYMSIQEPDLAIEAYQKAFNLRPHDTHLAGKLGRAYVKSHQYNKAIAFYQQALCTENHTGLKLNLAELYLKLKQFKNAQMTLEEPEDGSHGSHVDFLDIDGLQLRTKQLLLLARVHEKAGNTSLSLQTLKAARDNQDIVQKRISVGQSGNLYDQYKTLSKICLLMAQYWSHLKNNAEALACLEECLKYTPNDIEILTSLARLYIQMDFMDSCREICLRILQIDNSNEAASVIMADLSFRKMDLENATYHFSQLLLVQPCYWTALARLVEVMRRSGTLLDVVPFLKRSKEATAAPDQMPGLQYCNGLYEWYTGNPNGALRHFNAARKDTEWGQQAIFNMIEICINPDGDIPKSNDLLEGNENMDSNNSRLIALKTADRLLKELHPRSIGLDNEALNHQLMHNFLRLASKEKYQVEQALQDFIELSAREENQDAVGPILGMATALVMLKQTHRAKNNLKRLAKVAWKFEEAEYLERSWLLLADIYINSNKWDMSESLIARVLEYNKSSAKAYELSGYIAEKSQQYRDAAKRYENAWNYCGRSKPHIGYKLAYNHMKTRCFANAIEICQQVLKLHPDYTVIRKDIFEKCRNNLRS